MSISLTIWIRSSYQLIDESLIALLRMVPGFNFWDEVEKDISPDVILLVIPDQQAMPELLSSIIKQHPDSRVLCLFWQWAPQQVRFALLAGATGCLEADIPTADFVTALRQAARGELTLSPELQRSVVLDMLGATPTQKEVDFDELSPREQEVLELLCKGLSNKQIGQQLYLSVRTVENHLRRLYQRLGVSSRTEAVLLAIRERWVETN